MYVANVLKRVGNLIWNTQWKTAAFHRTHHNVRNNHTSREDICSLACAPWKAPKNRRVVCTCVFWLTIIQATGLFRRVTDCLMVDCRALLRGSSDWVAAKHLAASRGAPRRQSSYNREVILRKMSSSSGTSDENGGFARAMEIFTATSKHTYPDRK